MLGRSNYHPGKRPEDARIVIESSPALKDAIRESGYFLLKEYLVAYEVIRIDRPDLGFEPLAENPETTARDDLKKLAEQGYLIIDKSERPYKYRLASEETFRLLQEALTALPAKYRTNPMNHEKLAEALKHATQPPTKPSLDERAVLVFSEKLTFDQGLGVILPDIAKNGIAVAVITSNDEEGKLIDALNLDANGKLKPKEKRIIYGRSIHEIGEQIDGEARYCYYRLKGEEGHPEGVIIYDITVQSILDMLGKMQDVPLEKMNDFYRARQKFIEAAA